MRRLTVAVGLALALAACRSSEYVTDSYYQDADVPGGNAGSGGRGGTGVGARGGSGGAGGGATGGSGGSTAGSGGGVTTGGAPGTGGASTGGAGGAGTGGTGAGGAGGAGGTGGGGAGGQPIDMALPPDMMDPLPVDMAGPRTALLVVGTAQLNATDTLVRNRLMAKLMNVEVVPEAMAIAASATGKAIVAITSTTTAAGTNTKFRDVGVPVFLLEPNLMGPMRMTADVATDRGTVMETRVTITAPGHPLAAGLTGNVTVYSSAWRLVWGLPGAAAVRVANVTAMNNRPAIFAYEPGAPMLGGTAPAKRVAFFLHENMADVTTPDGVKLLDAAIDWCVSP
jgi:hypothetical protein